MSKDLLMDSKLNENSSTQRQIFSFAKINIGLRIIRKRPDGYHDLETIFQEISVSDRITCLSNSNSIAEIRIFTNNPQCPASQKNLAFQAADLLRKFTGEKKGCDIIIDKKIPVGAGLGGGSSNAASVLVSLNKLWDCNLANSELVKLASQIGSDVPFFVVGGCALGRGRGEILTPIKNRLKYWGLLISPSAIISTKWVYENLNFDLTKRGKMSKFDGFIQIDFEEWQNNIQNDLENVVFRKHQEFQAIKEKLYSSRAFYAQMSGSGSSLYGLFVKRDDALAAQKLFKEYKTFIFKPRYV